MRRENTVAYGSLTKDNGKRVDRQDERARRIIDRRREDERRRNERQRERENDRRRRREDSNSNNHQTNESKKEDNSSDDNTRLTRQEKLGFGTYSKVYKGIDQDNNVYAVKINLSDDVYFPFTYSLRELNIVSSLEHDFILPIKKVAGVNPFKGEICSPLNKNDYNGMCVDNIHFIYPIAKCNLLEYCEKNKDTITMEVIQLFIMYMLLAIEYLHFKNYIHRDIKINNILVMEEDGDLVCKLTDFGLSKHHITNICNTPDLNIPIYRAPECILKPTEYTYKIDIWCLGCIIYEIFHLDPPFYVPRSLQYKDNINKRLLKEMSYTLPYRMEIDIQDMYKYEFTVQSEYQSVYKFLNLPERHKENLESKGLYEDFHDLVLNMFQVDPEKRYTATQCLNSNYFSIHRDYIEKVRQTYLIESEDDVPILARKCPTRKLLWESIANLKNSESKKDWYSNRIIFHAIILFDRVLYELNPTYTQSEVNLYFRVCIYMFIKYFNVIKTSNMIKFTQIDSFETEKYTERDINKAVNFERIILDKFEYKIYHKTLYDFGREKGISSRDCFDSLVIFIFQDEYFTYKTRDKAFKSWYRKKERYLKYEIK